MSDENFWDHPQGAAVFKHAVLRAYAPTFASKTGHFYGEGHVGIVDGYAGPGAYDDGSPGSPEEIVDLWIWKPPVPRLGTPPPAVMGMSART